MQNIHPKKPKGTEPFIKVFFSTLTRVGSLFIIAFGVLYFGIRKVFFVITKKKDKQTLYQFITELDSHLNVASKQHKGTQYKKPKIRSAAAGKAYSPVKKAPVKQNKTLVVKARPKKYPKHLPKIIVAAVAAAVIIATVFVIKGIAARKNEASLKQPEAKTAEQLTGSVYEGKIDKRFESGLEVRAGEKDVAHKKFNSRKITETYLQENIPTLCSDEPVESIAPVETTEPGPAQIDQELMLHKDETNALVPLVQERLMDLYYMDADEPTDFYGQQTEYAIQLFQRGHGLMVDGVAGYESLTLLFSDEATPYLVHKGDKGWDIKQIQKRLKELGYLTNDYSDEVYDEQTYAAIRAFQGRNKLEIDGVIGHNTLQVIFNGDAKPAHNYTPPSNGDGDGGSSDGGSYDPNDANAFVSYAKAQLNKGYTYIWGGKGPPGMDCSGFVYYCLKQTGNGKGYMTSAAWAQSSFPTISSIHDAKPGDILCFKGHVAICIGGGKMIDSSSSSNAIRIANYESSSYWNKKWICAKRVFP